MPAKARIPADVWIDEARKALISDGISGVKVDRIARKLGVTRGGFYHHFENHDDLLSRLLDHWRDANDFLPARLDLATPASAFETLQAMVARTIEEKDFSPSFEIAIREWARIDKKVRRIVHKVDLNRLQRLTDIFRALGCDHQEAEIRAKILYYHQMGYYGLAAHQQQTKKERSADAPTYLRILCGQRYIDAAKRSA